MSRQVSFLLAGSLPIAVELNTGESTEVQLATGRTVEFGLIGYEEITEPFYEAANKRFVDAVVAAEVEIEVNGKRAHLSGGPYCLPLEVNGVSVLVSCTRGWTGGSFPDDLEKDVRLEIKDAAETWVDPGSLIYPLPEYRWRASNYQHTYLGIVVNQPRLNNTVRIQGGNETISSITSGQWYKFDIFLNPTASDSAFTFEADSQSYNLVAGTYSVFIDNAAIKEGKEFRTPMSTITNIGMMTEGAKFAGDYYFDNITALTGTDLGKLVPVPEPQTAALFAGFLVLGFIAWRRRR